MGHLPSIYSDGSTPFFHGDWKTLLKSTLPLFFMERALHQIIPFLHAAFTHRIPIGKYPLIIGEGGRNLIYAQIEQCHGKGKKGSLLEAHEQYVDIHAALLGKELIGIAPLRPDMHPSIPYDAEKDVHFFHEIPHTWIDLKENTVAVIAPGACHAPLSGKGEVTKLVIKVHTMYCM